MREREGFRETLAMILERYPGKTMLSVEEAAICLGCDRRTITKIIERKKLPAVDIGLGNYRIYRISTHNLANYIVKR